jgi:hypothetical protein
MNYTKVNRGFMRVVIVLKLDASEELHRQASGLDTAESSTDVTELLQATEMLGISLEPMHPGQTHPLLAPYFTVEVPNHETADSLIDKLRPLQAVEAAYFRPEDELP